MLSEHMKVLLIFFTSLLLSACVTPPPITDIISKTTLDHWTASGKLGIKSRAQAKAVNFKWENRGDTFHIKLHGAMGFGSSSLSNQNGIVELKTKDGIRRSESAESLLQNILGWTVPVDGLRYWIKGAPSPVSHIEFQQMNPSGDLEHLHQQGWKIHFQKYQQIDGLMLPRKIVAKRDQLKLTIAIKNWRF